jgi:hypothetical protein
MKRVIPKLESLIMSKTGMSKRWEMNRLDESLVTEIVLASINDIHYSKKITSIQFHKTDFEIEDESVLYGVNYCLQLKELLVDDAPLKKRVFNIFQRLHYKIIKHHETLKTKKLQIIL